MLNIASVHIINTICNTINFDIAKVNDNMVFVTQAICTFFFSTLQFGWQQSLPGGLPPSIYLNT